MFTSSNPGLSHMTAGNNIGPAESAERWKNDSREVLRVCISMCVCFESFPAETLILHIEGAKVLKVNQMYALKCQKI